MAGTLKPPSDGTTTLSRNSTATSNGLSPNYVPGGGAGGTTGTIRPSPSNQSNLSTMSNQSGISSGETQTPRYLTATMHSRASKQLRDPEERITSWASFTAVLYSILSVCLVIVDLATDINFTSSTFAHKSNLQALYDDYATQVCYGNFSIPTNTLQGMASENNCTMNFFETPEAGRYILKGFQDSDAQTAMLIDLLKWNPVGTNASNYEGYAFLCTHISTVILNNTCPEENSKLMINATISPSNSHNESHYEIAFGLNPPNQSLIKLLEACAICSIIVLVVSWLLSLAFFWFAGKTIYTVSFKKLSSGQLHKRTTSKMQVTFFLLFAEDLPQMFLVSIVYFAILLAPSTISEEVLILESCKVSETQNYGSPLLNSMEALLYSYRDLATTTLTQFDPLRNIGAETKVVESRQDLTQAFIATCLTSVLSLYGFCYSSCWSLRYFRYVGQLQKRFFVSLRHSVVMFMVMLPMVGFPLLLNAILLIFIILTTANALVILICVLGIYFVLLLLAILFTIVRYRDARQKERLIYQSQARVMSRANLILIGLTGAEVPYIPPKTTTNTIARPTDYLPPLDTDDGGGKVRSRSPTMQSGGMSISHSNHSGLESLVEDAKPPAGDDPLAGLGTLRSSSSPAAKIAQDDPLAALGSSRSNSITSPIEKYPTQKSAKSRSSVSAATFEDATSAPAPPAIVLSPPSTDELQETATMRKKHRDIELGTVGRSKTDSDTLRSNDKATMDEMTDAIAMADERIAHLQEEKKKKRKSHGSGGGGGTTQRRPKKPNPEADASAMMNMEIPAIVLEDFSETASPEPLIEKKEKKERKEKRVPEDASKTSLESRLEKEESLEKTATLDSLATSASKDSISTTKSSFSGTMRSTNSATSVSSSSETLTKAKKTRKTGTATRTQTRKKKAKQTDAEAGLELDAVVEDGGADHDGDVTTP